MSHKQDILTLSDSDPMKGPSLSLWSDDFDLVERFRHICYATLPKSLSWFHQCSSEHYHMFEFWNPNSKAMKDEGVRIAAELGITFSDELAKNY